MLPVKHNSHLHFPLYFYRTMLTNGITSKAKDKIDENYRRIFRV
jgi:hypothetical protein